MTISGHSVNTFIFKMQDAPTAVQPVTAGTAEKAAQTVYNLQGQSVTQMIPGRIYVVGGRKVVAPNE